jgi:Reverse transcriptase (RNA-dependent DNA polymerase)
MGDHAHTCLHCGPLRVPDWRFAVVRGKMDEGILGKEVLTQVLGLDLGKLFEKARQTASSADSATLVELTEVRRKANFGYLGVKYFDQEETSDDLDRLLDAGFGIDTEAEIHTALDELVQRAKENGIADRGTDTLQRLVREFRVVWAIKLGPGAPADVPPMRVQLQSGARPRRAAPRRWSAPATAFISATTQNLEKIGALINNPLAAIASPAHAVSKASSGKYRMTVYCRTVNACCVPTYSAVLNIDTVLAALSSGISSCPYMAKLDFPQAFWQIALDKDSQELFSIQTPLGIYTPTRMMQGSQDASNYFHGAHSPLFDELSTWLKCFLDDFRVYCRTEAELLRTLRQFFCNLPEVSLKVISTQDAMLLKRGGFLWTAHLRSRCSVRPKGISNSEGYANARDRRGFVSVFFQL